MGLTKVLPLEYMKIENSPHTDGWYAKVRRNPSLRALLWPVRAARGLMGDREEAAMERHFAHFFRAVEGGSVIVKVPEMQGSFELDARSTLLKRVLKKGHYEPVVAQVILNHLNRHADAIDIGANAGFFTVLMAKQLAPKRRVLAIEPTANALRFLRSNIARNNVGSSVVVCDKVVMDKIGEFNLHVIPGKEEYSCVFQNDPAPARGRAGQGSLEDWMAHAGIAADQATVVKSEGETVDNLVDTMNLGPGFIKMDAEGAEYLVLQGARKTLERWKPAIISEVCDMLLHKSGHSAKGLIEYLTGFGYRVLDAENPGTPISSVFNGTILALPAAERS